MIRDKLLAAIDIEIEKTGISDRALSVKATGSTDTIRNIRRGAYPRIDTVESLLNALGMDIDVRDGAASKVVNTQNRLDEIRLQKEQKQQTENLNPTENIQIQKDNTSNVVIPFDPELHSSEHVLVPKLDVRAAAGHGVINETEEPKHLLVFSRDWLHKHGLQAEYLSAIEVDGDSMEPTLLDGETILVNRSCPMPPPIDTLVAARINNNELVVKRLYQWDDSYVLLSDNRIYQPIKLKPEDELIGEVIWRGVWIAER